MRFFFRLELNNNEQKTFSFFPLYHFTRAQKKKIIHQSSTLFFGLHKSQSMRD